MTKTKADERPRLFEEEYFLRRDAELVDKLKSVFRKRRDRDELRAATGIRDEALLDRLVTLNLNRELFAAFQIFPLVEVARADGSVDAKEIEAVLRCATDHGLDRHGPAYAMLRHGLENGAHPETEQAWYAFAAELRATLTAEQLSAFRTDLLDAAHQVAEASGGLLGIAFTVSRSEHETLRRIEDALASPTTTATPPAAATD